MADQHVVVSDFGTFVGKKGERLQVKRGGELVQETPFHDIEQVSVFGAGVTISSDAIRECSRQGIQMNFVSGSGEPYAKLVSPALTGTVVTRREQLLGYFDARGVTFAKVTVEAKIRNQANVLKYFAKHRREAAPDLHSRLYDSASQLEELRGELLSLEGDTVDKLREVLLSVEGRAGRQYWAMVQAILPETAEFTGRERRGATDPVNSLLNYGYGMLYHQVSGALSLAGLDPYAGFLHADRAGKPSLVLDVVEVFRQPVVDRAVIAWLNRGFVPGMDGERLDDKTRRELAAKVLERLEDQDRYDGAKHRLKTIIQMQCRRLAMFFRGEGAYRPYVAGW
ncbi:MAG: CRISPR-associated endonuclease Cas1 [Bacillota bacterium]|nr:MAG: CRISPR-associated endonuclease Cas1 [Bacillota bacterium]